MSSPLEVFRRLTNGVYVVTATDGGTAGGFTAAWVTQVAFEPLLLAVSINPGNATWPLIQQSGRFVVNVLSTGQLELARRFGTASTRDGDKFAGVATAPGDVLRLSACAAWLDCRVEHQAAAGDHILVVARVVGGGVSDADAAPLRYAETGNMDGSALLYANEFPRERT